MTSVENRAVDHKKLLNCYCYSYWSYWTEECKLRRMIYSFLFIFRFVCIVQVLKYNECIFVHFRGTQFGTAVPNCVEILISDKK